MISLQATQGSVIAVVANFLLKGFEESLLELALEPVYSQQVHEEAVLRTTRIVISQALFLTLKHQEHRVSRKSAREKSLNALGYLSDGNPRYP